MLRYALPATLIVGGFVVVLATFFGQPSEVAPRTQHPAAAQAEEHGTNAGSVVSVKRDQSRLQLEMDALTGALRNATAHQLQELATALTGSKPRAAAPSAMASPQQQAAPAAAPPAPKMADRPVAPAPARRASAVVANVALPRPPVFPPAPRRPAAQVASARHPQPATLETQSRPEVAQRSQPETPVAVPAPPAVAQLVSANQALQQHDPAGARGLLEAAETSVVFAPAAAGSRGNSIAAAQITEALRMVAAGDPARAMQYVARALIALRPASPSSGATVQADLSR